MAIGSLGKNGFFLLRSRKDLLIYLPTFSRFSYLLFVHRQKIVVSEYFPFPVTGIMIEFVCCVCIYIYMCI